jgi:hypothetical protein
MAVFSCSVLGAPSHERDKKPLLKGNFHDRQAGSITVYPEQGDRREQKNTMSPIDITIMAVYNLIKQEPAYFHKNNFILITLNNIIQFIILRTLIR